VLAAWVLRTRTPAGVTAGGWTTGLGEHLGRHGGPGQVPRAADPGTAGRGSARPGSTAPGSAGSTAPGSAGGSGAHPGSQAAADLLRELDDMGI